MIVQSDGSRLLESFLLGFTCYALFLV